MIRFPARTGSLLRAGAGLVGLATLAAGIAPQDAGVTFSVASPGLAFRHENGASPDKYMPETMGSGGLIFDYDADGWPDIFLVNGGSFVDADLTRRALHGLYRNDGNRVFTDVTDISGIGVSGYGMGACAADYDNDGRIDLYITSAGPNRLYRNLGGGAFDDVTSRAGVGWEPWSASCAFGDIDNDGDVDLYVANYVNFTPQNNKYCGNGGVRDYCHPHAYDGLPDVLYRNEGDGTFTDISAEAGISLASGKGLGVVMADYDIDGRLDIYVANDSVPNFMFRNLGGGKFEESAMWAGVAVGVDGRPLAGMGTDMADVDNDGLPDVFVTNLNRETHNLYRSLGNGQFQESTFESGLGAATLPFVGFGAAFFDYDNDTDLDLAIANGDVLDNAATPKAQLNLLLANDGTGRFSPVGVSSGPGFAIRKVSRGLVVGDLDNDGRVDILVTHNADSPDLLWNEGDTNNHSLIVRLVGSASNRDGIGATVRLGVGGLTEGLTLVRTVRAGSSYLGQTDLRVHFGLGAAESAGPLDIVWPSGVRDRIETVDADRILTVTEGLGVTDATPFTR
jgi:hypothetical protein